VEKFFLYSFIVIVSFGMPLEMYGTSVLKRRRRKNLTKNWGK
jgi:hypothetical protein